MPRFPIRLEPNLNNALNACIARRLAQRAPGGRLMLVPVTARTLRRTTRVRVGDGSIKLHGCTEGTIYRLRAYNISSCISSRSLCYYIEVRALCSQLPRWTPWCRLAVQILELNACGQSPLTPRGSTKPCCVALLIMHGDMKLSAGQCNKMRSKSPEADRPSIRLTIISCSQYLFETGVVRARQDLCKFYSTSRMCLLVMRDGPSP